MSLAIVAVPTDSMSQTNCVYVSPEERNADKISMVMISGVPFQVAKDPQVKAGTIALNAIQRRAARVTTTQGDSIDFLEAAYVPPKAHILMATLEIEYISSSKKGGTLDCIEFTQYFLKTFQGQYFVQDQQMAVLIDSTQKYIAHWKKIEALTVGTTDPSPIGQLQEETKLLITTNKKCEIQLINVSEVQMDSQQENVVNPFNLENLGIGGLRAEFGQVFRRAFASRIFPKSLVKKLGIRHVKGILLYGPPGTGKTLIARKIGEILNCAPPQIVNGPEVFNKYVGGTEENIRKLFAPAEAEQKAKGDQSQLHLIIFDEFDAICKQRGAVRDNTGVADNVVNQLLSKIDGVDSLNNVLLIGMTNRKDLLDDAILRPGRFEVHVEIGLPDEHGRVEIFRIHTRKMRENNILDPDVELEALAAETKNFSGAEIEGVVVAATSHAFNRHIDFENPSHTIDAQSIKVAMKDFQNALKDIKPAFGQATDECAAAMRSGIIDYGPAWKHVQRQFETFVHQLSQSTKIQSISVLLEGPPGCGKSAAAAHIAVHSGFPYVKFISPDTLVGYGEVQKSNIIRKAFEDAYKSTLSVVVLDDIERLIEYSQLGARYSNVLLQTILVLVKRPPPAGKKILIVGTTSLVDVLESLEIVNTFSLQVFLPSLDGSNLTAVVAGLGLKWKRPDDERLATEVVPAAITVKKLILVLEMAADGDRNISYDSVSDAILATGVSK